ncbi:uncharacterized protein DUF4252 [Neolewinella xylanilytica]|uniref:Uncharacterized protein DUF4252 n=1 Tax=Neolewinella xylanilytica TaxID=1514080 RepID=A0A2S6I8H8_9BACT|nr:DUF4252 domain-containing protein [Neolewinella xylanilytica]PPK87806.1 uncharacterized protein DUF4252 [Neolewinella xylanilytica]
MLRILLLLCLLSSGISAQDQVIRDFIKEHRRGEENVALTVPGWLIGLASDIAEHATDDPHEQAVFSLAGELGTLRVLTYDNEDFEAPGASIVNLLFSLERYKDFERWADIRTQDGERISLTVRYKKERIRDLVVVLQDGERTTLVSARANLSATELGELVANLEEL